MNRTIDSNEVTLVKMEMKYWKDVHSYASLSEVSRYQQWGPNTEEDTLTYIKQIIEHAKIDQPSRYVYAIKETRKDRVIGAAELFHIDLINKSAEIGYVIHPDYWGMGYASEAVSAILAYGFDDLELTRIGAVVFLENGASNRLLKNLGFQREGILRRYIYQNKKANDVYMYSLVREVGDSGNDC